MNKRVSVLFTIAAVAVMGATLFGSTYTQTQIDGQSLDINKMDVDVVEQIHQMGGLHLVMPQAFAETDCGTLESSGREVHDFQLTGTSVDLPMLGHTPENPKLYKAMTFSGQIPGPTVRVTQGDVISMTLTIPSGEATAHGNDMHASQMSSGNFGAVQPGTSKTYCYIAQVPGVFKYHCSGVDVAAMDQHVLSGMYGITIVDPLKGYKKLMTYGTDVLDGEVVRDLKFYPPDALEFQLQYSQQYLTQGGFYDQGKMFQHRNTGSVVNGMAFGYVPNSAHNLLVKGDMG